MGTLTARLEVRLPPRTLQLLRQEARIRGMPVAQLVREAIELWLMQDRQARMQAAESLFQIEAPVANWPEMKQEIEEAHLKADLP
ncbi:MAG: ribbon-helix-helix protein, CopG family [Nitrospinota bacterium]|nr:MAG: ribbon-helix-helix protein, CopG family [Nitrospinota bacterium]